MYIKNKYNKFLNSEWWKVIRNRRFALTGKECERCGNEKGLHVHHSSYEKVYAGLLGRAVKFTNILCGNCHKKFHEIYGVEKDMRKQTKHFIKWGR